MYKEFLKEVELALKELPEFKRMKVTVKVMNSPKKEGYYGTSIRRFVTDGEKKFSEEGIISLNFKGASAPNPSDLEELSTDCLDNLLKIIAHEAEHLLDDKSGEYEKVYEYLKSKNLTVKHTGGV